MYLPEMRGRYVIVEEKAEIVRELFHRYAEENIGIPALVRDLNHRRIPAARGGIWHPMCLAIILHNPVYKGQAAYGRNSYTLSEAGPDDRHFLTGKPLLRGRAIKKPGKPILLTAPPIVSEELWNQAQRRLETNQALKGGNPRRARMLSGRSRCDCGHNAALVGKPGAKYYQCSKTLLSKVQLGEPACQRIVSSLDMIEHCVIVALKYVAANPDALSAAMESFLQRQITKSLPDDLPALRREKAALDAAIVQIGQDESATVQAQIAGIRAGASPDVYQSVFADIAARRKDLEDRRGAVMCLLTGPKQGKKALSKAISIDKPVLERKALEELASVLSSDTVPGYKKRDIIATVIDHVVCKPDGADVFFLPGVGTAHLQAFSVAADAFNSTLTELMQ